MTACNDCWDEAFRRAQVGGRHQAEHYEALLLIPPSERHWCAFAQTLTEGVGTGAGGGATGQDIGTAWVNRSEDCPEAPAQAHPLTPADPHAHDWADLADLDGVRRTYLASYCRLCGETQID